MTDRSTTRRAVYSFSIAGRVNLAMHSLNNEGGEGNQINTRMVTVVYRDRRDSEPRLATVNAISGDMLKHIQAEHLYLVAKGGLPLCGGCQTFSGSRIGADPEFMGNLPEYDSAVIDQVLKRCAIDDLEGSLIARGARSVPRKSVAEFAWLIGLPDLTSTNSYFHVRYATERGGPAGTRVEQPIFHRPASSGVYAIAANFETARIGFNDITQQYPIDDNERHRRFEALLQSAMYTFIQPNGAMRGTQNPHIVEFEGAIAVSYDVVPAPLLSPLGDNYREQMESIATQLNRSRPDALMVRQFGTMGEFAQVMSNLVEESYPYKLFAGA